MASHEPTDPSLEQFKQKLWDASPKSRCGICGKELRGASGMLISTTDMEHFKIVCEGKRGPNLHSLHLFDAIKKSFYFLVFRK